MARPAKPIDPAILDKKPAQDENRKRNDIEVKACPKCGDVATGAYQDAAGLWRCNCGHPKCNFWDSMVYFTPEAAATGWNAAGGPDRFE